MNKFTQISGLVLSLALVAGCANTPNKSSDMPAKSSSSTTAGPSAPANTAKAPAKPADQGAVAAKASKSNDNVSYSNKAGTVYYPSGARDGAALTLEKMMPEEVSVNTPFDYQIKVTNVSNAALEDVMVKESLDEGFSFKESTPKGNAGAGRMMAFDLGNIQAGQSKTITISGSAAKQGSITSCATLEYRIASCASVKVSAPGLNITKTMTSDAVLCDTITGKITVSNPGSGLTRNVMVKDMLADGLMTSDGKKSIEIKVGDLAAGQSKDFPFSLKADKVGKFTNMASASADGIPSKDSAPVSVTVRQPVLAVKAECPAGPMMIGRPGTYKFTVSNKGDAPAANAVLNVDIPTSMKFTSADNSGSVSGTKLTYNLGTLAPNETRTLTATYKNITPGVITARAQLLANCATEQRDSCETKVEGVADIGVELGDDVGVTTVGEGQIYRCEVKNQGQIDLTDVKVVATWPGELEWVSTDMVGVTSSGSKTEFKVGTLQKGEIRKFSFTLKAKAAGEYKINTVTTAKEIKNALSRDEVTTYIDK